MMDICAPALIYLIFSLAQIIIDTYNGLYNTAFMKFIVMVMITFLLNALCLSGLSVVSWVIVFVPFILMTVIVTMLLYVLGLDVATGKFKDSTTDKDDNDVDEVDDVSGVLVIDDNNNGSVSYITPDYISSSTTNTQVPRVQVPPSYSSSPAYESAPTYSTAVVESPSSSTSTSTSNVNSSTYYNPPVYSTTSSSNNYNNTTTEVEPSDSVTQFNSPVANYKKCDLFCAAGRTCTEDCKSWNCPSPTACDSDEPVSKYDNSKDYSKAIPSESKNPYMAALSLKKKCNLFCLPEVDTCSEQCKSWNCPPPTACNY